MTAPASETCLPPAGLAVLSRPHEVARVDGGRGELAGLGDVGAASRAPGVAGLGAVGVGGCVAHLLERIAPVAEVLRAVGDEFQLAGLDFRSVLLALEVAELGAEPVDAAVEAPHLGVEGVDEAPEQALALICELEAVGSDALGDDAERFAHGVERVVFVPDLPGVELVALGGGAEELCVLANGSGD